MLGYWVPSHTVCLWNSWSWKSSSSACSRARHSPPFSFPPIRIISCMDAGGSDSNGREYKSADEMWREHAGDPNKKTHWYREGVSYWEGVKATVDGVLGGYANVNDPDISCSEDFLKSLLSERFPAVDVTRQPLVALGTRSLPLSQTAFILFTSFLSDRETLGFQIVVLALAGSPKIY